MKLVLFAAALAVLAPSAALAKSKDKSADASDPNRVICRTENATGSRLSSQKRCMTAQEWAEAKRIDRQDIEKVQANRYKND